MVRKQTQEDHEDAWKKLFVIAFVAVIVATVSLQVSSQKCRTTLLPNHDFVTETTAAP